MTLTLAARMTFDASKARAELRGVGVDTKAFATQTRDAGNATKRTGADIAAYEARVASLEAELRGLASAMKGYEDAARRSVPANNSAAGSVGNMAAQFNDVFVTVAAGQNPLQVAIQQGTQIGQAFGGRGAAGAVALLKQGFLQMISPVNLGTIAIIAGGAALIQWAVSALGMGKDADTAAKAVDRLAEAVKAQADAVFAGQVEIDKLRFGVDEEYQVELLREQIRLRTEYNAKVAELNTYLSSTSDSIDLQRVKTQDLRTEIEGIVAAYTLNGEALASQAAQSESLATTLAVIEGVRAQRAAELEASQRRSADEAARLAGIDMSRGIQAAGVAAADLANLLGISVSLAAQLGGSGAAYDAQLRRTGQSSGPDGVRSQQAGGGRFTPPVSGAGLATPVVRAGGGGGGAAAANAEADAVQKLIQQQQRELDILRETDPVKKELLRQREALAEATGAERRQIEGLIRTRIEEEEQLKNNKALADFANQSTATFLDSLIVKGAKASDVIRNLANSILQAGIQAFSLGQGPLAGLLGITGGLFGGGGGGGTGAFGLPRPFARGGEIRGPGTGTSDSILARLSDGEFVVNARAAARHRGLLEMINAGVSLPAFARGGQVAPSRGVQRTSGPGGGAGGVMNVNVDVSGAKGNAEIEQMVILGVQRGIELYNREVLPGRVLQISNKPRVRGA
jgi:Prophage tail length tape measure protein